MRATLDAPVLLDGDVHGVLRVQTAESRTWDEDEINFVATGALLIALAMEASQRQEAESRIEQLAWYDSLTGLPNRNLLRETMRDMIMTAANRRRRIAVMLIDLDRFKDVNDTLGHLVGDSLIKSAAQIIKNIVAERGIVSRLGGDEFVVVLNDFEHRQEVALLAARLAQSLHRTDLVPNVDTQVSASIGIALFPEHGREMSTLLKNADAGMYQAKRDGRNQFSFFNPIRHETAAREVQLGIQMLKALQSEQPQFILEYQPQVQMNTGRVVGLEALIRWQHPTYGRLTPDRFIGVAEVSGLSERITRWLVNDVCAQIVRWRAKQPGFDIPISINVAGREMGSASLPIIVRTALAKHAVEPHMITLEITERTLVKESEVNNDVMNELATLGVGLVLDDFGTGYSMLAYLKRMPIKALKIDQSFIEGVPNDADSCAIVHAMLAVARHFKLKVVAEGIETPEQVEYLRNIGCEFAQGFYYSRALPPQTILEYIEFGPGDTAALPPGGQP
jgi:diguanylate cyclase (GGDEF)-like protein